MRVRTKILILFLALALVPLALVGLLSNSIGRAALESKLGDDFQQSADNRIQEIDRSLHGIGLNAQAWAEMDLMQEILTRDVDARVATFLIGLNRRYPQFAGISAMDPAGEIIASSQPEWIGRKIEIEGGMRRALEGKSELVDAHRDATSGAWVVSFLHPIRARVDNERVIGVLRADWRADQLRQMAGEDRQRQLLVLRKDGLVLSSSASNSIPAFETNLVTFARELTGSREGSGHAVQADPAGRASLIGYCVSRGWQDFKGFGWIAIVSQQTTRAFEPVERLTRAVMTLGFTVVAVVAVAVFLFARKVNSTIAGLTSVATKVAQGDFDQQVSYKSSDEIGTLVATFNQMIKDLKIQREQLVGKDYVESILQTMTDALLVVNPKGEILTVNSACCQMLGYQEAGLVGRQLRDVVSFEPEETMDAGGEWLSRMGSVSTEREFSARDGRRIPVRFAGSILRNASGATVGMVCVAQDITELKRSEAALRVAKEAAEAASSAKSQFLANMSHEIRTPMNAILGYSQILRRDAELPERCRASVETIERSGDHLLSMINDILDLSKIEAGKMELQPCDFDLRVMVTDLADMFRIRCQEKDLDLRMEWVPPLAASSIPLRGDEGKIRQVLINLLGNAVKFTESGAVILRIVAPGGGGSNLANSSQGEFWSFEVSDTGKGMSASAISELFKPFQQGTEGVSKGGTGLGLAISKRQVELMGGEIGVRSVPGEGSTFHVRIPLAPAVGTVEIRRRSQARDVARIAGTVEAKILVVDDVRENRDVLSMLLAGIGCEVITASDGYEALEKVRGSKVDLVFLDIRMPGMDGREVARVICEEFGASRPRLVAISASVFHHEQLGNFQAGFDAFLGKPFRFEEVCECLGDQLGLKFIYTDNAETTSAAPIQDKPRNRAAIPGSILARLQDAAERGSVTRLEKALVELDSTGEEGREVADFIRKLAESDDLEAVGAHLQKMTPMESVETPGTAANG